MKRLVLVLGLVIALGLFALPAPIQADQGVRGMVTYYTINDGTDFIRSTRFFRTGVATQENAKKGGVTASISNTSGYADSGFVVYDGKLGDLTSFTISGEGSYGLNLWFDTNNDGEFFVWNASNELTGLGGDTYGLGPSPTSGNLTVDKNSAFSMQTSPYGSWTLDQLKGGAFSGINSSTHVAIWVGVSGTGPQSATISSITGF